MSPIFGKDFDWKKSPAHLAFLATFIKPRSLDNHPTDTPWAQVLGEFPEEAVERFTKDDYLIVCSLIEVLAFQLPDLEEERLRVLLDDWHLSTEGTKDDLVLRLVQTQNPLLLLEVPEPSMLRLTDLGYKMANDFQSNGVKMAEGANLEVQEATKKVVNYLEKLIGDGVIYDVLKALTLVGLGKVLAAYLELEHLPVAPLVTPIPLPQPPVEPKIEITPTSPKPAPAGQKPRIPDRVKETRNAPLRDRRPAIHHDMYIAPELVRVEAGEFLMGSAESDPHAGADQKPQHRLYLLEYWIGRYQVTNEEYRLFLLDNPGQREPSHWNGSEYEVGKAHHPVVYVSWNDALEYCRWLAKMTGERYTLPSEAEWEKAARGTDGRIYPWGDAWAACRLNTEISHFDVTTTVGKYSPSGDSPYGCADMAGNVWEWTRSLYKDYPYLPSDGREELNDAAPRVLRGGVLNYERWVVRCAYRLERNPYDRYLIVGFRVVLLP
jgi:formylglycine-generating enzyme required for sulfatase activity